LIPKTTRQHLLIYIYALLTLLAGAVADDPIHAEDQGIAPARQYASRPVTNLTPQNLADAKVAEREEAIGKAWLEWVKAEESKNPAAVEAAKARLAALQVSVEDFQSMKSQDMSWGQIAY
jgi:hypothetical protein